MDNNKTPIDRQKISTALLAHEKNIPELEGILYSLMSKIVLNAPEREIVQKIASLQKQYAQGFENAQNVWARAHQHFEDIWNAE